MSIRFCAFCSTVHPDEATHCPECGTRLIQEVTEEQFNDPATPWPFEPVNRLCLRIQGQPRNIRFSGTHSVYHLWSRLHSEFEAMTVCYHRRKDEIEMVAFPHGGCPDDYHLLDPGFLINCRHRKFSFYTYEKADPEVVPEPGAMELIYHGNFEFEDCPAKECGNVLGWLAGTVPSSRADEDWTYDI